MKIRTSLLLLLSVSVITIGIVSGISTTMVKDSVYEIINRENPKIEAALEMEINVNEMVKDILEILERQDKFDEYENNIQDFRDFKIKYESLIRTDDERDAIKLVNTKFEEIVLIGNQLIELHVTQLDLILERRMILNNQIEVELDDRLQPSQKRSDPQYIDKMLALEEMEINIHELISASRGYLLYNDQFLKERIADSVLDFKDAQRIFLSQNISQDEKIIMDRLGSEFTVVEVLTEKIIILEDKKLELLTQLDRESTELDNILDDNLQRIALEKIHEDERQAILIIDTSLIILPIIFAIILIGGYLFSRKFTNITDELIRVTNEFKNGNLDARIKVSRKDEIGDLGNAMNVMAENLKLASKQQGEFAAMVTHELKTPLVPIKGYAEMLNNPKFGKLSEDQKEAVDEIYKNANQLERLIHNVLNAQKLEVGGTKYNLVKIDVDAYLSEIIKTLSPYMIPKNIEFTHDHTSSLFVKGDESKLTEIFTNIVQNAVDFTPDENGKIKITVKETDTHVEFCIDDNGVGMSEQEQQKLFQKFYQVDTSHVRKHGGSGLGLAICKGYVSDMGGKIWVQSEKGIGSKFYFTIPKVN